MSERQILHAVISVELYLPPLKDKSMTVAKLKQIASVERMCVPSSSIEELPLKSQRTVEEIRQAISIFNTGPIPFWFSEGRPPSKHYLLNILRALDPEHPMLGTNAPLHGQHRVFKINEACEHCVRCYWKEKRQQSMRQFDPAPYKQRRARPVGVTGDMTLVQRWRHILRSRYNVLALGRTNERRLQTEGADSINLQVSVQIKVSHIDRLMDTIVSFGVN